MAINHDRIRGFDGLRGIAVLLVLLRHKTGIPEPFGNIGVWLFFVLSGFLIVRILADRRAAIETGAVTAPAALKAFFWRRAWRLLPLYYVVLASYTLLSLWDALPHISAPETVSYWLHSAHIWAAVQNEFPTFGHLWSLGIEEQFYLLAVPLLLLCPRRHTLLVCALVVALGLFGQIGLATAGVSDLRTYVLPFGNFAMMAFGGVIGLMADRPLPRWAFGTPAQLTTLVALLSLYPLAHASGLTGTGGVGQLCAVFAGLLLLQIYKNQAHWLVQALEARPLVGIGKISYGLYLIHGFVLLPMLAPPFQAIVEIALAVVLAALSYAHFERPLMQWAARRWVRSAADSRPSRSAAGVGFGRPARSFDAGDTRGFPACAS